MNARISIRAAGLLIALVAPFGAAHAQLGGLLHQAGSANASASGSGGLGAAAGALLGGGSTSAT